jgi:hypothetical protein
MISVSDTVGIVLLLVIDSFDYLEPVVDGAREIFFESVNSLSVRLLTSFQTLPSLNVSGI